MNPDASREITMRNALALPILFALVGCAGKNLDIGPTGTGGPASMGGAPREMGGAVVPLPTWPDPGACDVSGSTAVNGVWKGYIEMMPAPWDTLLLVIRGAFIEGTLCGTMTIGTGTPPP